MVKEPSNPPKGLTVDTSIHTSRSRFADFSPGHENQGPILSQLIQDAGPQICIELMQLIFKKEKKKFKKWKEALNRFFFSKKIQVHACGQQVYEEMLNIIHHQDSANQNHSETLSYICRNVCVCVSHLVMSDSLWLPGL